MSDKPLFDVLIVGAGPAGLTASYLLTKKSPLKVCVLEANPEYVGGISRTEKRDGYHFDIGGHRFFSKSQEVENLWREILPDDFLDRPRTSRILYRGKFYSYPLRAFEALWNLGILESILCVLSYMKARAFPAVPARSFHQWVSNQFGERLFGIFFKTYTEKVWGMSCDDISADWAAQRIKGLSLFTAVLSALKKSIGLSKPKGKDGKVIKTLIESFRYPRKGPGMMWEEAARKTLTQGGRIDMGVSAQYLDWDESAQLWTIRTSDGKAYQAKHVISSAPMRDVVSHVTPPARSANAAAKLKYRDFLTVALTLNTPAIFDDNWIYIHDPSVKVGRIQNYVSWSPEMIPANGKGCLGLEYFCFEGDGLWSKTDDELVALAKKELVELKLAKPEQITGGYVVRQPKAYPVYDDEYKQLVSQIREEFAERYPTLHFVGRNGMHKYNNQDHAMMTAMLTAENIIAGKKVYDIWDVNEDAEYHESGSAGEKAALSSVRAVPQKIS